MSDVLSFLALPLVIALLAFALGLLAGLSLSARRSLFIDVDEAVGVSPLAARAKRLLRDGRSVPDIANRLGVSEFRVYALLTER